MKIIKKNVKGKEYLYAYDNLYIAKTYTIQKTKCLGPVDAHADLSQKKYQFEKFIISEEKKLRASYWKKHIQKPAFSKYASIPKIENLRTNLYRAKKQIGEVSSNFMETAFMVDFIYNSNKIEGSKVPREAIAEMIHKKTTKKSHAEVTNSIKAVYYMKDNFQFKSAHIKKLHAILLTHEPAKLGLRTERVVVGNSEVVEWEKIPAKLKALLDWYKNASKTWYPPELAFEFYYRFEKIHPFIDGNGRVGRLLMNKILKDHRYHPIIIWNKRRLAHLSAFEKYDKGQSAIFYKFLTEQFIQTHKIYLEKIQDVFNIAEISKKFMELPKYSVELAESRIKETVNMTRTAREGKKFKDTVTLAEFKKKFTKNNNK